MSTFVDEARPKPRLPLSVIQAGMMSLGRLAMGQEQPVRVGRRLAATVTADVAGYSRLMGLDEVGTARTLREHRKVTDALVPTIGGFRENAQASLLIGYGPSLRELDRQAAGHVGRILNGAQAGELPSKDPRTSISLLT
jgi:hypothetical protein